MQRKILVNELRNAYFQSIGKRAFTSLPEGAATLVAEEQPLLASLMASVHATDLFYMRPKETLPLGAGAFNDEKGIGKAYRIGWEDALRGFTPYDWRMFDL